MSRDARPDCTTAYSPAQDVTYNVYTDAGERVRVQAGTAAQARAQAEGDGLIVARVQRAGPEPPARQGAQAAGHTIWCTRAGCAPGRPCPSCAVLLAEREAAEATAGGLAGRVAWFHAPHPRSEVTDRARADTRAWRIYTWWRAGQHSPAAATPEEVRAAVAGVPELALTGRHAPRHAGQFADVLAGVAACEADWAARAETTHADMIRDRRSRQWRAGYELRHAELAETLCYRPRGGGDVVHRGHCGECQEAR